jgi:hypothetical protein
MVYKGVEGSWKIPLLVMSNAELRCRNISFSGDLACDLRLRYCERILAEGFTDRGVYSDFIDTSAVEVDTKYNTVILNNDAIS